jgi:hypothetical protein
MVKTSPAKPVSRDFAKEERGKGQLRKELNPE